MPLSLSISSSFIFFSCQRSFFFAEPGRHDREVSRRLRRCVPFAFVWFWFLVHFRVSWRPPISLRDLIHLFSLRSMIKNFSSMEIPWEDFHWTLQVCILDWFHPKVSPSLNFQDLVPLLDDQDPNLSENFEEALSSCPDSNDLPSKKLKVRNSQCPNIPSGPINLPDVTNLWNSININELPNDRETVDLPSFSKAIQTFCVDSASGPRMIILVCGSVTYADGAGQNPGYFIVVRNSWIGQCSKWQVYHRVLKELAVTFPSTLSCSLWDFFCCEYWDPDLVLQSLPICRKLCTDNVISRLGKVWFEGLDTVVRASSKGPWSFIPLYSPSRRKMQNSMVFRQHNRWLPPYS